jgi:hypothetical protein
MRTVNTIIRVMNFNGYEIVTAYDEEGFRIPLIELGSTETETVVFQNKIKTVKGWVTFVYDNEFDWDGSDVVADFGGDSLTMEILEWIVAA